MSTTTAPCLCTLPRKVCIVFMNYDGILSDNIEHYVSLSNYRIYLAACLLHKQERIQYHSDYNMYIATPHSYLSEGHSNCVEFLVKRGADTMAKVRFSVVFYDKIVILIDFMLIASFLFNRLTTDHSLTHLLTDTL